jgi:type II restriction/modification system DNA methylase subunit YeeA
MTPQQFIAKWKKADLSERAACQSHFLDLCELFGEPKPTDADPKGEWYTFEKGVDKADGGKGFADVWKQGHFGWEYKGKHKNLKDAYQQLLKYREALENPPILVVCDLDRFEVHTNFTGTAKKVHAFDLDGLADPANLGVLRNVFKDPEKLKPGKTQAAITEEVAGQFARLAEGMAARGIPAQQAAHFLMKLMFCMFAEDIELLPRGLFARTVANAKGDPVRLSRHLKNLFESMAHGEPFGPEDILHFNGGLFADSNTLDLTRDEIDELTAAARCDWSSVEPTIFGTLFERTLDPSKRAQIGAHYTSREDIETLIRPVILEPLRREWEETRTRADALWEKKTNKARKDCERCVVDFLERLAHVTILDPACGSGNFLYVAINLLLDLEKEVLTYAADHGFARIPLVRPTQLRGLEINPYAVQLAQIVVWIGWLQWLYFNGYLRRLDPVLEPIDNILHRDAILDLADPANPKEPEWPEAEFIVGNPPFLGGKMLRTHLGDDYVDAMFRVWGKRVRPEADLCCYWFEKARAMIEAGKVRRAGLLATQGIRGGANRQTLARIKTTGDIFFAESDRDWILDGANVHISMIGFDDGAEAGRTLDGRPVAAINPNLTATADITTARPLAANLNLSFMGDTKGGAFDIPLEKALELLHGPNVSGKPSSDVVIPWCNGLDVTRRGRDMWIIDFGVDTPERDAALYEAPFEYARTHLFAFRQANKREAYKQRWWIHVEARPAMRAAFQPLTRFVAVPRVAKHQPYVWLQSPTLPDCQLIVFARSDDYFFGVLHSRLHQMWGLKLGTRLETRPRYTPTTCFETFPFPEPTAEQRATIAAAAKDLDTLRNNWLNPPEWTKTETLEFPGSVDGPWKRYVHNANARGIGAVRFPRTVALDDASAAKLKKRTLTNLYNEMPTWLKNAHAALDAAVFDGYGWPPSLTDDEILARLLDLNLARAGSGG